MDLAPHEHEHDEYLVARHRTACNHLLYVCCMVVLVCNLPLLEDVHQHLHD